MFQPLNYESIVRLSSQEGQDNAVILSINDSGSRWAVKGFLTSPISLPMSSTFSDQRDNPSLGWLNSKMSAATELANRSNLVDLTQARVQNIAGSMVSWTDSSKLAMTLELLFVKLSEDDKILDNLKKFYDGVLPEFDSPQGGSGISNFKPSLVKAPGGYVLGDAAQPEGVVTLKIGRWLKMVNILVMTNFNPTFSREVTPSGSPLYATASVSLQSYRLISAEEMKSFFTVS